MFRLLGTPPDQKRYVLENGSHFVPRTRLDSGDPGVAGQVSAGEVVRSQESGVRSQESGVRSQELCSGAAGQRGSGAAGPENLGEHPFVIPARYELVMPYSWSM